MGILHLFSFCQRYDVNCCSLWRIMSKQLLNSSDINTIEDHVCSKAMTECMDGSILISARLDDGILQAVAP